MIRSIVADVCYSATKYNSPKLNTHKNWLQYWLVSLGCVVLLCHLVAFQSKLPQDVSVQFARLHSSPFQEILTTRVDGCPTQPKQFGDIVWASKPSKDCL